VLETLMVVTNSPWYFSLPLAIIYQTALCVLVVISGVPAGGEHHDPKR